jgi:signal transduction histidine kinase
MAGVKKINYPSLAANACILLVFTIGLLHFLSSTGLIGKILPRLQQMQLITAFLLLMSSVALWIFKKNNKTGRVIIRITGVVIVAVCLITLPTNILGNEKSGFYPYRMALLTAFIFLIVGVIFILFGNNSHRQDNIAHILFLPAAALSYFCLVTYILNVYDLFQIGQLNIAPGAALSLFILCLAILFLKLDTWLMRILSGSGPGSIMGRRLLPWIVILPIVIAVLRIEAERYGLMSSNGLVILVAILYTLSFLILVWLNAWAVNRIDVSRRKAEEALQKSEEGLRALLKASSNAIYRLSHDWQTIYSISGSFFSATENMPFKPEEYIPPENLPEVLKAIKNAIRNKSLFEMEHRVYLPDGSKGWNHSRAIPVLNKEGDIEEWFGLTVNITDQKKAEEALKESEQMIKNYNKDLEEKVKKRTNQLEKARERAESADKLKTSFLLNMSHELRTPLNSIIGFSGILLKHLAGPLNREQEKQLEMVQKSGRHLLSLINDILDISKINTGELKPEYELFNFLETIEEVKKLVQPFADIRGIDLRFTKDPAVGEIVSDKKRVRQIFINLLNNAIKFTEKGSVTITCYRDPHWIITEVKDTGIGIREDDLEHLFNPFMQLENDLTRKFEGSGLGLSITKKLLEMLHGLIGVKSELGVGSTFTVKLPVTDGA